MSADVIVIGAGPAGNGVARRLAVLGHDVVVLEARERIGDKLCTGIVGTDCLKLAGPAGATVLRDIKAATCILPSGKAVRFDMGRTYAHVVDRVGFVASIAQSAQEVGAEYPPERKVTQVAVDNGGVEVRAWAGQREEVFKGKALVLANGFGSGFARSLGLGSVEDYVLVAQVEVKTYDVEETELYLGRRFAPGFFGWMVPTHPGNALIGVMARRDPLVRLRDLVSKLTSDGKVAGVTKQPSKWGMPLKPPSKTYGDRVLVVGDAAGQVKPTTGGGIYYSLLCGEMAADTLHEALDREDFAAERLRGYESRWKARLGKELMVGYYARRFYEALGDRQVEFLTNNIAHNGIHRDIIEDGISSFDWHAELILKGMKHSAIRGVIQPLKTLMAALRWGSGA